MLNQKKDQYIAVKVVPGASKTKIIEKMADGTLKIAVAEVTENGKANRELLKFIEKEFSCSARIISGAGGRKKLIKLST